MTDVEPRTAERRLDPALTGAYRLGFGLLTVAAITTQLVVSSRRADFSAVNFFSFFTNLSNILGAGVFLYLAATWRRPRTPTVELVRGAAATYLGVTGVVYNLLLRGITEELGIVKPWVNFVIHVLMPIVVVLDWLFDPPRHRLALRRTAWWLAFPLAYLAYSLIRGAATDWYPYPFLNPSETGGGYLGVLGYVVAISAVLLGFIWIFTALGNRARSGVRNGRAASP
jgi:hypothetical protein